MPEPDRCLFDAVQLVVQVAYTNGYRVALEDVLQRLQPGGAGAGCAAPVAGIFGELGQARRFEDSLRRQLLERHGMTMEAGADLRRHTPHTEHPPPPPELVICRACALPWGDGWEACSCGCASTRTVPTSEALEQLEAMCRARLPAAAWQPFVAQLEVEP